MLKQRKRLRLQDFDYSQNGAYFVTICTRNRECLLGSIVGADSIRPQIKLSTVGQAVDGCIKEIPQHYPHISVEKYVIMPNHIHLILLFARNDGRMISAPTLSNVIGQMKRRASKITGIPIWQRSFHDHIIRTEQDYAEIWQYIDANPLTWEQDCFYQSL